MVRGDSPPGDSAVRGAEFRAVVFNAAKDDNIRRLHVFLEGRDPAFLDSCLNVYDGGTDKIALVVASRNGNLDVVRYLLSKGADPTVRGTVSFDGETIFGAPPLWAAAAAGHLHVTRCLVEEAHVDINQTTQTNSSPLRGACYDGHLDIVKFLVENGADMELANRHGHTPLMIASFRKKFSVVKYLLDKGANPLRSSYKGNTALHDAAEADCYEICKLLLEKGAALVDDDGGVCPLLGAAMLSNLQVFRLLMRVCSSAKRRQDALKMLGCTFIDKKMDFAAALDVWEEALDEECEEDAPRALHAVYEGHREIRTHADLDLMKDDPDALRFQALIIRERILGGAHSDVHYFLRLRGAVYCDLGEVNRCFQLWMYALELQQQYLNPLHASTMSTLMAFQETLAVSLNEMVIGGFFPRENNLTQAAYPEHINCVFEKVCVEMEKVVEWGSRPMHEECLLDGHHEHNVEEEKNRLALLGLQLLILTQRVRMAHKMEKQLTEAPPIQLDRYLEAAAKMGVRPLHLAVVENACDEGAPRMVDDFRFPSTYCVEKLIEAGVDVNVQDEKGDSALHLSIRTARPRLSIVRLLLDAGAFLHARNLRDETCASLLHTHAPRAGHDIRVARYMSLFGLAANVVRREKLPFESIVPAHLYRAVSRH